MAKYGNKATWVWRGFSLFMMGHAWQWELEAACSQLENQETVETKSKNVLKH